MTKKYNLLKAASWYTIGNILIKGIAFFLLPVFTGIMSTKDYGIFSVYSSYLTLFETIILLGLSSTVRVAKYSDDVDYEEYMATIIKIPFIITGMVALGINIYFVWYTELLSMDRMLWNCLLITAVFAAVINIISARLVIDGNYLAYMGYSGGYTLLNIGISLCLCYTIFSANTYMARVVGGMVPNVLFGVVFGFIFTKRYRIKIQTACYAIRLGIPLLLHTAATVVLVQSDRILIKAFEGFECAGIYSIAVTIIAIPMILQSSLDSAWAPWFYEKLKAKDYESVRKVNNSYIVLFALMIAGFMVIAPEIIYIFTEKSYWESIYSLIPLSMSVFAEMLYSIAVNVEYFNKKTWMITQGTVIAIVINIFLDIVFIKMFGYIGAAYGTVLSKFALFIIHWLFSKKIDKNAVFSTRPVVGCILGLAVWNVFVVICVEQVIVRYCAVAVLIIFGIVFLLKNKNMLLTALQKSD